jgi:hypothetical protein
MDIDAARWTGRPIVAAAAGLSVCGAIVVLLATHWGIGTSVDSIAYLQGARALAAGTGEPALVQHAPLYSFLLAGGAALGLDPMDGARWLNAFTLGANIYLVGFLIRGAVTNAPWLSVLGSALMLVLSPMLVVHVTALSEPVFLTCILVAFWLLSRYLDEPSTGRLLSAAAVMSLALLARYAGAAAVLTGAIGILAMAPRPLPARIRSGIVFCAVAVLPMAAWMVRNMLVASTVTGRELAFHPFDRGHVWQALYTMSGWLLIPPSAPNIIRFAVWLGLAGLVSVVAVRAVRAATPVPTLVRVLALFIVTYGAFLIASISFLDANTPLDDRILLPVLAIALVLGAYVLDSWWPSLRRAPLLAGAVMTIVLLLVAGHGVKAAEVAVRGYERGWGFTSADWRQSPTLARLAELDPDVPVYSNAPEIVYLHARRDARGLPRTRFLMNQQPNQAFGAEMEAVAETVRASCGVVAYLRNLSQQSMPGEAETGERLSLDLLAETPDGVIWGVKSCRP